MTNTRVSDIAARMQSARDEGRQIPPFSAAYEGLDLPTAYAVADALHRTRLSRGDVALGRKIGFTNPDMWPLFGVDAPVWAHVYQSTVVHMAQTPYVCSLGSFFEPKIEPEIILHFSQAPPVGGTAQDVLACVDWISHGIEIVQCHYPGWQFKAPDTIVDLALHATLLVGEHVDVRDIGANALTQLEQFSLELFCHATSREKARGSNVLGSPLLAMAHLTNVLAVQPGALPVQAGEIVTTGTITKAYAIQPGETWRTTVHGIALPGLSIEFTA
jgi:2-keto-4-pentenoate hydratase